MIEIIGKGDHNYQKEFDSEEEAFDFLWSLVGKMYGFYNAPWWSLDSPGDENGDKVIDLGENLYVFDIEDDLIIWRDPDGEMYCAGWHWLEEQSKQPIMMPNGRTLYNMFRQIAEGD